MTTLKLSIMASRAELSQQTLVVVPVINSVSMPRSRSWRSTSDQFWMKALSALVIWASLGANVVEVLVS